MKPCRRGGGGCLWMSHGSELVKSRKFSPKTAWKRRYFQPAPAPLWLLHGPLSLPLLTLKLHNAAYAVAVGGDCMRP